MAARQGESREVPRRRLGGEPRTRAGARAREAGAACAGARAEAGAAHVVISAVASGRPRELVWVAICKIARRASEARSSASRAKCHTGCAPTVRDSRNGVFSKIAYVHSAFYKATLPSLARTSRIRT